MELIDISKFKKNIALIGMPAAGKTTLGVRLAAALNYQFVDTDRLIEKKMGEPLQSILDQQGYLTLREIEQQVILQAHFEGSVIATGGSAVYGELAMQKLKLCASVIYLELSPEILSQRINNWQTRGIACAPSQSFEALYAEREPLYQGYADQRLDCSSLSLDLLTDALIELAVSL